MAGLEAATAPDLPTLSRGVHPAAAAALAWRHAQLLSALPRRDTEAGAWAHTGRVLLDATPSGFGDDIEAEFGGLQVGMSRFPACSCPAQEPGFQWCFGWMQGMRAGGGGLGPGFVVDVTLRRALVCLPT